MTSFSRRDDEASRALEAIEPDRVGAREEALLLGLRAQPEDLTRWREYAEAIAQALPEHAARIRSACDRGDPASVLAGLLDTLPEELRAVVVALGRRDSVVSTLWLAAEPFLAHHDALFRAAPLVADLILSDATDAVGRLALLPALRRYTALSFSDTLFSNGGAGHLARSPHLGSLLHLGLIGTSLDDEDLSALFGSRAFPRLTSLDLSNDREGQDYSLDGLQSLSGAAFAGTLEFLSMERRWFGPGVVSILAALPRLEEVELAGGALGDEGAVALAAMPRRWTRLGLGGNDIGDAGVVALAGSEALAGLRWLDLGNNDLGDEGALALARSPFLAALESLQLGRPKVSPETREALGARFGARVKFDSP
ncbi:hypothetical protein [Corallococcus sicarius]|uniref:TIGR02996 domain-containing protein n=1 Tax=Corallococcus sicarius TaxID=2316726 RepID=A0A3A8NXT2_9BACT|nr:hypothetical protein [Corallococcus sicarius]RKH47031.1 hypothetical protein D7X12_03900 [Corallococcus sicarius]